MFSRRSFVHALFLVSAVLLSACGGSEASKKSELKSVDERFPITVGTRVVQMQLVAERGEMEKGLMFRKSMGRDEGMLFIYSAPQKMSFWMRNTDLPLDIGFFDAKGELKEIYPLHPHDEQTRSSHGRNLQFALEMNQGWFKEAGVKPGARIDLKALAAGLAARGTKPESVGLK